jgi:hypothetical protein
MMMDDITRNRYMSMHGYPVATYSTGGIGSGVCIGVGIFVVLVIVVILAGMYFAQMSRKRARVDRWAEETDPRPRREPSPKPTPPTAARAEERPAMDDTRSAAFWRSVKSGSEITLKDPFTLAALAAAGRAAPQRDYGVRAVRTVKNLNGLSELIVIDLDDPECDGLALVVKIVEPEISFRVMWYPPEFTACDRNEILNRGLNFLFAEPAKDTQWAPRDLAFAQSFKTGMKDEKDRDVDVTFDLLEPGEVRGAMTYEPRVPGKDKPDFTRVGEWIATKPKSPPFWLPCFVFVEAGGEEKDSGGNVELFTGYEIRPTQVGVVRA